jgi:hypothetical protein
MQMIGRFVCFQVGSGESFGNDGIESDIIVDDDNDDEWEDIEDWKEETPNESNGPSFSVIAMLYKFCPTK